MKTQEIQTHSNDPLEKLHNYFEAIYGDIRKESQERDIVPPLTKDGALQYQTYQLNDAPKSLREQVEIGRIIMERFVGVASAAVNAKNTKTPANRYKFQDWGEVTSHIFDAFFTNSITGDKSLKTEVAGIKIAKTVIDFACSVIAGDVTSFSKFLKGFGEGLNAKMTKTKGNYNYLYSYSTHGLFKDASGNIFYTPTFCVYGTYFNQEQKKIVTSCSSFETVDLSFSVNTTEAKFKIEQYMTDKKFKNSVDNFLDKFEGKAIKNTESYFEGIFNAELVE
jgi:hypothetical protein